MKKMIISIHSINDTYEFIRKAIEVPGDITVRRGKFCADAKSVLGVFSIDMSQNVTVEYPESAIEFHEYIKQFQLK